VTTDGDWSYGIHFFKGNEVELLSSGAIRTYGDRAHGIAVRSIYGNVDITSEGGIYTEGERANGIDIFGTDGAVTLAVGGTITTKGGSASGIYAHAAAGDVSIENSGIPSAISPMASTSAIRKGMPMSQPPARSLPRAMVPMGSIARRQREM